MVSWGWWMVTWGRWWWHYVSTVTRPHSRPIQFVSIVTRWWWWRRWRASTRSWWWWWPSRLLGGDFRFRWWSHSEHVVSLVDGYRDNHGAHEFPLHLQRSNISNTCSYACYAQYTARTPTRLNCRVKLRRRCVHNSQLGDSLDESEQIGQQRSPVASCRRCERTRRQSWPSLQFPVLLSY